MMQIWDTAGHEKFRTITTSYYRGAHAIVIAFDITDRKSFQQVEKWLSEIDKFAKENVLKFIVGNKSDLSAKRTVSREEAEELSIKYRVPYFETSAKENINTTELFEKAALTYVENYANETNAYKGVNLNSKLLKKNIKNDCC